jgi:hypothetical protein
VMRRLLEVHAIYISVHVGIFHLKIVHFKVVHRLHS